MNHRDNHISHISHRDDLRGTLAAALWLGAFLAIFAYALAGLCR